NVKLIKLITPVAVPPNCGGLASLITVYGSIAAPDATPATSPSTYGGKTPAGPKSIQVKHPRSTTAPPMITGFRRPILSEMNPSSGQPMIHPKGTVADRITAEA